MAGHTPGPWFCERSRLDGHEWFVRSDCRNMPPYNWLPRLTVKLDPLVPVNGKWVAAGSGSASSDKGCCFLAIEENAANARLISAAPDLLEALQQILNDVEQGAIPNGHDPWWSEARAAIAKATGQS